MLRFVRTPLVADLLDAFGPDPGRLPDGEAVGSTSDDLPITLEALANAGWTMDPSIETTRENMERGTAATVSVFPRADVQVNFFVNWGYVAFDIDLAQLTDQESVDAVCAVVRVVGGATRKTVVLTHEGSESPVLTYDPVQDAFKLARA